VLAAAFLGWGFGGIEIGLFPLIARPALQSMGLTGDQQIGWWNSLLVACFLFGAAGGGVCFGWLGDKIGRVRSMVLSVLAYSLCTGACYFANQPWQLGLLRLVASVGMGGQWSVAVSLVMECWPERHRPKLAGLIGAAGNVGFLAIALVGWGHPVTADSWRWMMAVGALPAFLALFVSLFVPESERWKQSVRSGPVRPLAEVFGPGLLRPTLLAIMFCAVPLVGTWAAVAGCVPLWVDQITQAEMAKTLLTPERLQTFEAAPTPDAKQQMLRKWLTEPERKKVERLTADKKAQVGIIMAAVSVAVCFLLPALGGRCSRRGMYFVLCAVSLLSCGYLFRCLDRYNLEFLLVAGFVGGVTGAFYGLLPLYLPELFPTRVRATGQGLSFNSGRILAGIGTLYMGSQVGSSGGDYGKAMAAMTLVYLLGMVVIWFAPETQGKPLPE
jgi:MFS family permease